MRDLSPCDYAIIRVVPLVERAEFINAGVILFCRPRRFLVADTRLNRERLRAVAPGCDVELVAAHLASIAMICGGGRDAGPIGQLPLQDRFHWLVAPRSTVIQTSPVHVALAAEPAVLLEQLVTRFVLVRPAVS